MMTKYILNFPYFFNYIIEGASLNSLIEGALERVDARTEQISSKKFAYPSRRAIQGGAIF